MTKIKGFLDEPFHQVATRRALINYGNSREVILKSTHFLSLNALSPTSQASYSVFQAVAQEQFNGRLNGRLNSEKYREVLLALHKQKLFTPNNIKAITQHSYPNAFISALQMLNQASPLNQQTFNTLKNQSNPASLAYALRILHRKKLLSATNDKTLYQYTDTKLTEIAKIVRILDENNILDKKIFKLS